MAINSTTEITYTLEIEMTMTENHLKSLCRITAVSMVLLIAATKSSAATALEKCLRQSNRPVCWLFYSRHDAALVYIKPVVDSVPAKRLTWGEPVRIDWKKTKTAPVGWVYYSTQDHREYGWIEAKDLAGAEDFRRVVACWPIKYLRDDDPRMGDFEFTAHTNADGQGWSHDEKGARIYVWFTENLIMFGPRPDNEGIVYAYDPGAKIIYRTSQGGRVADVGYMDDVDSRACKDGLRLQR